MHRDSWSSIGKAVKNVNYAYSSEDTYSRVFGLTHHIEKLEVCMHRDSWSSIGKAVKNLTTPIPARTPTAESSVSLTILRS